MKRRIFLTALTLAFTGAVAPGPMLVLVFSQVLAGGPLAVIPVLLGHALVEVVYVVALARGLGGWLQREPWRSGCIIIGGIVLVTLGGMTIWQANSVVLSSAEGAALGWWGLLAGGMGVSLSNPYFTGWWMTVGSGQLAMLAVKRTKDYVVFMIGHELGDIVWYGFIAVVLGAGRGFLSQKMYQTVVFGCGVLVVLLGLVFLFMPVIRQRRQAAEDCAG